MNIIEDYHTITRIEELESKIISCKEAINLLTVLPQKLSHKAQIPLNSVCSFPGKIINTNKITVKCGDFLVERSASDAIKLTKKKMEGRFCLKLFFF